ncbi:MAG: hypothetical protein M3R00_08665, partial [Pseudomonadota bacterium]|nr:hypothetical protein [Pseudomonadota bacterium]
KELSSLHTLFGNKPLSREECVNALDIAILLGKDVLNPDFECEYAKFLRDDPRQFVESNKKSDSYPSLLIAHFDKSAIEEVQKKYFEENDAEQILLYNYIAKELQKIAKSIEKFHNGFDVNADPEIQAKLTELDALITRIQSVDEDNRKCFQDLESKIKVSATGSNLDTCVVGIARKLFEHVSKFANYDPDGRHPF